MWAFEQRVKDTTLRDGILTEEELRLLDSRPGTTPSGPSQDRYGNELTRRWLAIYEVVLYLKSLAAGGEPVPASLNGLPPDMKNRLNPYLSIVKYQKENEDSVVLIVEIPEAGGIFVNEVQVNLKGPKSFQPAPDQ